MIEPPGILVAKIHNLPSVHKSCSYVDGDLCYLNASQLDTELNLCHLQHFIRMPANVFTYIV